jgi:iron complex outermembrane recepter protein
LQAQQISASFLSEAVKHAELGRESMKSALIKLTLTATTALALITPAMAQDSANEGGLEEIIVTAQKREQSVQDVPIAVTAVTQESLKANRIFTVNDLGSIAPGVSVRPSAGGVQVPSFTIRGQNSFGVVAGSDKQVSIYLDGVYVSSPRGSIFELPDVTRLEVLRGPQGTLFGRNATAGAVSVTTRDPDGEFGGKLEGSYANRDGYRLRASLDLPQMGPFSAYFSFLRNSQRGEIRNAAAGQIWDRTLSPDPKLAIVTRSPEFLGTSDSEAYFAAVKFESGDLKMVYKFDLYNDRGTPDGTAVTFYNAAAFPVAQLAPALTPQSIYLNESDQAPSIVSNGWSVPRQQKVLGHSVTATWQASDSLTVKNIFAYRTSRVFAPTAIDGLGGLVYTQAAFDTAVRNTAIGAVGGAAVFNSFPAATQAGILAQTAQGLAPVFTVGGRILLVDSQAASIAKQWSDELQVNYSSDKLQVTAGALWFHSADQAGGPERMQNTIQFAIPLFPASGSVRLGNEGRYFNKATSLAAYAQLEYKLSEQIQVVGGARVTSDKKTSRFRWDSLVNGVITPRADIVPAEYKATKPSFMLGLNYKPNDDTLIYGKWSNSFVSGGSVAGIEFVPETASSWELGFKSDFLDRKLRTNLALFYVDYKNFQQPSSTTSAEAVTFLNLQYGAIGTALSNNLSTFVQQAHDVRAKGFELEVTALPARGLTVGGSVSYTKTDFLNIKATFLAAQSGEYSVFARPAWTGSLYAAYESQPIMGDATFAVRFDGLYRSTLQIASRPIALRAQGVPERALNSPAHWKLNGRAAIKHISFGSTEAELAIWGRNITNKRYANSVLGLGSIFSANYDPGRTYGVELGINF